MPKDNLNNEKDSNKNIKIVQTDIDAKDGQTKCPKCGATDISLNVNTGKLRCHFCRYEFEPEKLEGMEQDVTKLKGKIVGSGASDISSDTNDILTFKCSSCGAEVVIDTSEKTQARCHWCRNTLSINQQIPNGAIPDVVLPFGIKKDIAQKEIEKFVNKRKFFAHPKFKMEFCTQNIMGVYFPYMIVDVNAHVKLTGQAEKEIRRYTVGNDKNKKVYYDADLYNVKREFDLIVDDLTIESSFDKLNTKTTNKTNNIINAIMPFDTDKCVKWNANYLRGFTSEKRDVNIEQLKSLVEVQVKDIARYSANQTVTQYDRGVCWSNEALSVKGQQWQAAYLPVWLYSYQQINGNKQILHYVAVNARTKETMGSVPINMSKLFLASFIIELFALTFWWVVLIDEDYGWLTLVLGFIFFFIIFARYRNSSARHTYEKETKTKMDNLNCVDDFVRRKTRLSNARMHNANNHVISGQSGNIQMLGSLVNTNLNDIIK